MLSTAARRLINSASRRRVCNALCTNRKYTSPRRRDDAYTHGPSELRSAAAAAARASDAACGSRRHDNHLGFDYINPACFLNLCPSRCRRRRGGGGILDSQLVYRAPGGALPSVVSRTAGGAPNEDIDDSRESVMTSRHVSNARPRAKDDGGGDDDSEPGVRSKE
jgi:hypothetical protein